MLKKYKFIQVIVLILFQATSYGQLSKLEGVWITPSQDLIQISDTTSHNYNYLCNKVLKQNNFHLALYGDTLSFQDRYTSSLTNFEVKYVDRYDFKVEFSTDSILILKPVSSFSKKYFQNRSILKFTRQEFTTDRSIKFEKLYFESSTCCDETPKIKLHLDSAKRLQLNYKIVSEDFGLLKSKDISGTLSDALYQELIRYLQTCNLRNLRFNNPRGADGVTTSLIINYNGQQKYLKSMFPPRIADDLIRYLETLHSRIKVVEVDGKQVLVDG